MTFEKFKAGLLGTTPFGRTARAAIAAALALGAAGQAQAQDGGLDAVCVERALDGDPSNDCIRTRGGLIDGTQPGANVWSRQRPVADVTDAEDMFGQTGVTVVNAVLNQEGESVSWRDNPTDNSPALTPLRSPDAEGSRIVFRNGLTDPEAREFWGKASANGFYFLVTNHPTNPEYNGKILFFMPTERYRIDAQGDILPFIYGPDRIIDPANMTREQRDWLDRAVLVECFYDENGRLVMSPPPVQAAPPAITQPAEPTPAPAPQSPPPAIVIETPPQVVEEVIHTGPPAWGVTAFAGYQTGDDKISQGGRYAGVDGNVVVTDNISAVGTAIAGESGLSEESGWGLEELTGGVDIHNSANTWGFRATYGQQIAGQGVRDEAFPGGNRAGIGHAAGGEASTGNGYSLQGRAEFGAWTVRAETTSAEDGDLSFREAGASATYEGDRLHGGINYVAGSVEGLDGNLGVDRDYSAVAGSLYYNFFDDGDGVYVGGYGSLANSDTTTPVAGFASSTEGYSINPRLGYQWESGTRVQVGPNFTSQTSDFTCPTGCPGIPSVENSGWGFGGELVFRGGNESYVYREPAVGITTDEVDDIRAEQQARFAPAAGNAITAGGAPTARIEPVRSVSAGTLPQPAFQPVSRSTLVTPPDYQLRPVAQVTTADRFAQVAPAPAQPDYAAAFNASADRDARPANDNMASRVFHTMTFGVFRRR